MRLHEGFIGVAPGSEAGKDGCIFSIWIKTCHPSNEELSVMMECSNIPRSFSSQNSISEIVADKTVVSNQFSDSVSMIEGADRSWYGMKVLVVDDSAMNRKMMVRMVKRLGSHEVLQATDGIEAVQMVSQAQKAESNFDLILMDNIMPNMSGQDATAALRTLGVHCTIVGVTGNALPEQIDEFLAHGADKVLTKPLAIKDVQDLLFGECVCC
jgi:CheY-like chemotaxis protein